MIENDTRDYIHVQVSFPISPKGPYETNDPRETTVGAVLNAAMTHFEVHNDSQFRYLLSYDGIEQKDSTTIGSLAGEKEQVRFNLIKKITQG